MTVPTCLSYATDGAIATLTLTRPERLNMLDNVATAEIVAVIEGLRRPREVRCLVIASTGRAFSAGGDLDEVRRLIDDYEARMDAYEMGRRLIYGMMDIAVPVVAALQGDVFGLGTSLALSADIVVACRAARIGDPHVRAGLAAGDGGCVVFPAAFGFARARRALLTGDPISAEEAYRVGAVAELVDTPEEALPMARGLAEKIAALPPVAVQYTKRALNHAQRQQSGSVFELGFALEQYGIERADLKEALQAFKDKRPPIYSNR